MEGANLELHIEWKHLRKVLEDYGDYFIRAAREKLLRNGTNASGDLTNSLKKIVEIDGNYFSVSIELLDYWYYVEKGRKPGKFPPISKIEEWIRVKPVRPRVMTITRRWKVKSGEEHSKQVQVLPTVKQLAFLIARKIATKGTKPQPFFKSTVKETYQHFEEAIALAIDEDVSTFLEEQVLQKEVYTDLLKIL